MPETPEQLYERARDALRTPPVETWEQWPFEGPVQPRPLLEPEREERPRFGEGGVDCSRCAASDDAYLWTNDHWRLHAFDPPNGLPVVVLLEPRAHYSEPGDLPDDLAAELGVMLAHLHWWFVARPARMPQLIGSFAAIWDDVLPPTPDDVWKANLAAVVRALGS